MALQRVTRDERAFGIVSRQECIPVETVDGLFQVRDTATGSGTWHLATATSCDCYDASRGHQCKHQRAVAQEEQALASYAAAWDLSVALQQPQCPVCGSPLESRSYYVGGHGYQYLTVCRDDATHSNRRRLEDLPEC